MPDDHRGDRTEAPTARRRQEAREKGQVARSMDLNASLFLLAAFLALSWLGRDLVMGLGTLERGIFARLGTVDFSVEGVTSLTAELAFSTGRILAPLFAVLLIAGLATNLLQVGFLFTGQPLMPQFSRLNPVSGLRRLFSAQSAMRLAMSLVKVLVVAFAVWWVIRQEMDGLPRLAGESAWGILGGISSAIFSAAMKLCAFLLALAVLDYLFQRWQHDQDLRMTKQEVKDELRRYEGDPHIRQRRLQLQRQFARERMMKAVQRADVVITNPTHLAVAIHYDSNKEGVPRVVAKGARLAALRIREIAGKAGVPIVERKPLAQALYKACKVGDWIPMELFQAVGEVLTFVYGLNPGKREELLKAKTAAGA